MEDDQQKYLSVTNNNYLINAYQHIIKNKFVHFIFTLIEILLNIFQELNIYFCQNNSEEKYIIEFMNVMIIKTNKISNLSSFLKMLILFAYTLIFDLIYLFFKERKIERRKKRFLLIFNFLEFLYFRTLMLLYLNVFFSLQYIYFVISIILLIPHIYIIKDHFSYNHLYCFVPIFIEYPYDEFSSLYDFILLFIKILLSINVNLTNNIWKKYFYILLFTFQLSFSIYFINMLFNQSYLFMKNYFLNISKVSFFLLQTLIIIIAELIVKKELISIWFLNLIIGILLILLLFINLKYNPINYIYIGNQTPNENLLYYFNIISDSNNLNFLLESKINEHYQKCKTCNLCSRYKEYLDFCLFNDNDRDDFEEEEDKIIYLKKIEEEDKNDKNKRIIKKNYIDLFYVLYENKNNYFKLINEIILNYKYNKNKFLINSSYYYINFSYLIFSEFKIDNINLSLNIKLILEIINQENKYIDNQEFQMNQIIFCDDFISLCNKVLNQLKDIFTIGYSSAKKYIDLSRSLKEMQNPKFKDVLYNNYKQDNYSNLKNMIMICSILYEEIFNIIINSSQIAIRDNYQILDEIFLNNMTKNNRVITLSMDLINNNCKIIRAGKDLYKYKDYNLFDLFPLIFKDNQKNFFLSTIFESFNMDIKKSKTINRTNYEIKSVISLIKKDIKKIKDNRIKIKTKNEIIEIKVIICDNISTKLFYKLLVLKITPLFNYNFNSHYLLFDGTFHLYKNTIMTFENFNSRNNAQKIISISKPELENPPEIYTMPFEKYFNWLDNNGFLLSKLFEYKFSKNVYKIYSIFPKDNSFCKKKSVLDIYQRDSIGEMDYSELKSGISMKKKIENYLIEENASVASKQTSNTNYAINSSGIGIKNKKKQNMYRYSSLYKIKNTLMFSVPFIILTFVLEIIHLNHLKEENINNDYSILKFDEIYKIYFKLFSTTLNTACIKRKNECKSIASDYIMDYEKFNFNFPLFLNTQNKLFVKELLLKKNNLFNIHENIGNDKYQKIFEEKIDYLRISKTSINGTLTLILSNISIPFSEAILILFNSFQFIVNNTKHEPIYILNKKTNPFLYLNEEEVENFSDYQKEISEMILNYKVYKNHFIEINQKFIDTLASQSQKIELYIYLYFNMTLLICIYILSLLYLYLMNFEKIIIKILNFVNMVKNYKSGKFDFSLLFLEKINNLEIILKIYAEAPFKAIKNLNSLYNKYQKFKINQNKTNINNMAKKGYNFKKIIEEENKKDELDIVPINQRIFKVSDIRKLDIIYYYFLFFVFICLIIIIIYIIVLFLWINYSKTKTNLYSLIRKNLDLEISLYNVMNLYDLIIFNNLTIDEISKDIFYSKEKNIYNEATLLKSFYDDLFIAFNYETEFIILRENFKDFPYLNFTCENLYELNNDNILELKDYSTSKNITIIKHTLFDICKFSRLDEYNDMNAVYQRHYQDIRNAIISIQDFSLEGLINHLKEGKLGNIIINFNCILIYLLNIISDKMHKIEIEDLIYLLKRNLIITLLISILFYTVLIIIIRLFYIRKLKIYCNQVILLKKVFKIYEIQEQ